MNFKLNKALHIKIGSFLFLMTLFILNVCYITFTSHRNNLKLNESIEYRLIHDGPILSHFYQIGNSTHFEGFMDYYKEIGLECIHLKSINNETIYSYQASQCEKELNVVNYTGQPIFKFRYTLPKTLIFNSILNEVNHLLFFFIIQVFLLSTMIFILNHYFKQRINYQVKWEKLTMEKQKTHLLNKLASQVAHDIRSPLTALEGAILDSKNIHESTRVIIRSCCQSIKDIANNLLNSYQEKKGENNIEVSSQLLMPIIDTVLSQKRHQYRSLLNLKITGDLGPYGVFGKVNANNLQRIISNLINNSVESFNNNQGLINISLSQNKNFTYIKVKDNGKGISKINLVNVFDEGQTFGKKNGNGIGLHHAKETVESWGGSIKIESTIGVGTKVTLKLPSSFPLPWFTPSLNLKKDSNIVILDDDSNIHEIWKKRFKKLNLELQGIKVIHLTTPDQMINWYKVNKDKMSKTIFLSDFELINHKETGLDLIEKLGLNNFQQAFLITSHFQESDIQSRCIKSELKIIPKLLANSIPIHLPLEKLKFEGTLKNKSYYDVVHIEDTTYLRDLWLKRAKTSHIKLLSLSSGKELENKIKDLDLNSIFYIDQCLGNNEHKGEVIARSLFDFGFKNIFLSTGFKVSNFDNLTFLKGVVGKRPPW